MREQKFHIYLDTPSLEQAIKMKKFMQDGKLTDEVIQSIMQEEKPNQREKPAFRDERITEFFNLRNQIYCTDCMELMAHIPDGFVSLILTDPPYGISYQNHFARQPHKQLDGDCGIDYERFAWESYRILRDNSHAYFFTRFDCYPYHYDCLQKAGFTVKNCLVVEKGTVGGIGDLKGSFANNAEWIIFCQKGRRVFQQTQLLENRYKEGTQFHKGREPSKRYKTRFRVWLLRLGLIGDEFKTARHHLLKNLDGNIAWKDPAQAEAQKQRLAEKRLAESVAQAMEQAPTPAISEEDGTQEESEEPRMSM